MLTTAEIDRELASRNSDLAAVSADMVELDAHPGLAHVRCYSPRGVTAQRWADAERDLDLLWQDLTSLSALLESARSLRERRPRLDAGDHAELTRLLRGRTREGPNEILDRMRDTYPRVVGFLDAVDEIDSLIAHGLAPTQRRLEAAGRAAPAALAELLTISAVDPLSLTADIVEAHISRIAEMAALQENWPAALADTTARLDTLRDAARHAVAVCGAAEQTVTAGPLPDEADPEPGLRAELAALSTPDPEALHALQQRIARAVAAVRRRENLAQGLLNRRAELSGRLRAYQAKAARVGLGEHRELLSRGQIAANLLSRTPCDLRAATVAVNEYRAALARNRKATP